MAEAEEHQRDSDNQRPSANATLTLSAQLITTALAVLAVIGAFVTFAIDKREADPGFYLIVALSALLIFLSGVFGSIANDQLAANVAANVFSGRRQQRLHQMQTILLFLGIAILPLSFIFFGTSKESSLDRVQSKQAELVQQVQYQGDELQRLNEEVASLREAGGITP
jgi:hypothetical protein